MAAFNIQPIYIGALADHLGFTPKQLGLIAGVEIAGAALGGIAATFWVRRWNWHKVTRIALCALAIGNIASAFVENYELLAGIRFLTGFLGMGTGYAVVTAALSDTKNTVRNYSFTVILQVTTAILGFTFLPTYIAQTGISGLLIPLGLMPIALLPLVQLLPPGSAKNIADKTNQVEGPSIAIWLAIGCMLIWYLGVGGVWAFVERMGVEAGLSTVSVGHGLALGMVGSLLGSFLAGAIAERRGWIGPFTIGMVGQLVALWYLGQLYQLNDLIIAVFLFNGTWNFCIPYIFGLASKADRDGRFIVLLTTAQATGLTLGATLAGTIAGNIGLAAVTYLGAIASLTALVIFIIAARILHSEN